MSAHHYSLFGLICSPQLSEQRAHLLSDKMAQVSEWAMVPRMAARQQVGPLFYWHLKAYGLAYPQPIRRAMAAMYARQKSVAAVQAETLAEIIKTFADAGVEAVVIKGGAVAHIVYAEPGLRPMEDLDILVNPLQANIAHALLLELGFHAPLPTSRYDLLQHHLPLAQRTREDITVNVELHTTAFNLLMQDKLAMANLLRPLHAYTVLGQTVQSLNPVQMLWMQYLGLRKLAEPLRYIHLADLVGMAERLVNDIDWPRLHHDYPDIWNAYEAIHAFSPLNSTVCERLGLQPDAPSKLACIGDDYQGWPRQGFSHLQSGRDKRRLMRQSLCPPEWWARLVYGVRTPRSMMRILFYHHPANFFQQGVRRLYLGPVNSLGFFKGPT
ncbi:nucleotidyltransferase family protein [Rhodoferax sp.]|uniref:nucleotidyltransferase family protein n=1 Tax=Rhodoferax sp. TaxID=50421 RepID=UPI00262EE132|nr:nucleotidyltransferase family protein [Rhodoferax sp.]MDD2917795.1 nucleotidyltransferase family protein [Rhodoferax sp.]